VAERNPPWSRDELILALDLYFQYKPTTIGKAHPKVVELSELLEELPIHADRPDRPRFRNPNGVYMEDVQLSRARSEPPWQGPRAWWTIGAGNLE
jgi:hypothetical protein